MRCLLSTATLMGCIALLAGHADAQPKDSQGAKITRDKKLKTKITIEQDNQPLRDIIKELQGAVKDAGGGILRIKPEPNDGITLTSRMTIKAKDEPLEDVLDKLLKEKSWGYYVKAADAGDQDDGAIMLVTKPWRGSPGDARSAKKETARKDDPKKKEAPSDTGKDEKAASNRTDLAETYIGTGKTDRARTILEEVLKKYPDTKAAERAKKLLEKLGK